MDTGATWVLWIDSDAAFVNLSASMEPLLDDRVDLILSHGGGSLMNHWINTGVFLVRATPWQLLRRHRNTVATQGLQERFTRESHNGETRRPF